MLFSEILEPIERTHDEAIIIATEHINDKIDRLDKMISLVYQPNLKLPWVIKLKERLKVLRNIIETIENGIGDEIWQYQPESDHNVWHYNPVLQRYYAHSFEYTYIDTFNLYMDDNNEKDKILSRQVLDTYEVLSSMKELNSFRKLYKKQFMWEDNADDCKDSIKRYWKKHPEAIIKLHFYDDFYKNV